MQEFKDMYVSAVGRGGRKIAQMGNLGIGQAQNSEYNNNDRLKSVN